MNFFNDSIHLTMNDFTNFASVLSKFRVKAPNEIVLDTDVSFRSSPIGNILYQINYIANKIKPIMLSLNERIPSIATGPQILLKVEFLKINSVQQKLKSLIAELDKKVTESSLKLTPSANSCFENLSKFNSHIPQLIAVSAPTCASRIPEYQKLVTDATNFIDQILTTIPKIEQSQSKSTPAIDSPKQKQTQSNVAFINVLENLITDFYIIDSIEKVKEDEKFKTNPLKKWIENFEKIESICFPQVTSDLNKQKDTLNLITAQTTSLFSVLSQLQPLLSEPINLHDFVSSAEHSILVMQYFYLITNESTTKLLLDSIPKISTSLIKSDTKTVTSLLQDAVTVHNDTSSHISKSCFVSCGNDAQPTRGTIESLLEICKNDKKINDDLKLISIISSFRFYAMTVSDFEFAENCLVLLTREISLVLEHYFKLAYETSDRIYQVYNNNLSFFNEKILGYLSYFIMQVKSIKSLEIDSGFFIPTAHKAFNLIGSIPNALSKVISECKKEQVKKSLSKEYDKMIDLSDKYARWLTQLLISLSSLIQLSSETSSYSFNYLKEIKLQIPSNVIDAASSIQSILQSSPKYILMDILDVAKIKENFLIIQSNAQEISNSLVSQDKNPFYSLIIFFIKSLRLFTGELKGQSDQVTTIIKFDEPFDLVSALTAYLSQIVPFFKEAESYLQNSPKSFAFFFSIPYSCLNNTCAIITENSALTSQLLHYPPTAKVSLEVLWPIASSIASGNGNGDENEVKSLNVYSNSVLKLLSDMLKTVNSMPQPFEEINIPEDVRELKSMDKSSNSLKPSLKVFGDWIISWIRDKKVPSEKGIPFAKKWFRACQTPPADYQQAVQLFIQTLMTFLSKQDNIEPIFDRFCFLSVSLGDNEPKFGRYVSFMHNSHVKLFNAIKDILCGEKHLTRAGMKMLSSISQIQSFLTYNLLNVKNNTKQSDQVFYKNFYEKLFQKEYKNTLLILPDVIEKGKQMDVMIPSMTAMNQLVALDTISKLDKYQEKVKVTEILEPIQKAVMNKKSCADQVKTAITTFSERLIELTPNSFNSLSSLNNIDKIDDEINEKVESFRELSNIILAESNVKEMNHAEFTDYMKSQNVPSLEVIGLTLQGLKVLKLQNNKIYIDQLIEGFSLILKNISYFDSLSLSIHSSSKSANDELRYENRVIARQLDAFITMIESNSHSTDENNEDESELSKLIRKMNDDLLSFLVLVSHVASCALIAVVPEMFNKFEKELEPKLSSSYKTFTASVSKVQQVAVGPTSSEFSTVVSNLDANVKKFIEEMKNINFASKGNDSTDLTSFPQIKLVKAMESIGDCTSKICEISPNLTDVNIIEPDPEAAEMIPAKFEVPSVSTAISDLSPNEILSQIKKEQIKLEKVLKDVKENVFDNTTSENQTIVKSIQKVDESSLSFAKLCRQMIATCHDQRLGELQTAIFTFSSIVTNLHESTKKRLLREVNFEAEIDESFSQFPSQIKTIVDLSEKAAKKAEEIAQQQQMQQQAEATEGPSDEVTRELMATENAINEMSARLANFSSMLEVNNDDDQFEDELEDGQGRKISDIQAEEGTFPAFVISKATPALETTSLIIQRAQMMTKEILKSGSHLSNERALIKCAQEISEAAQLLIIVAEILIKKTEKDAEYKAIAAAKIIKASVAAFVAKILQMGGDAEGKMNQYVKVVIKNADLVVQRGEKIAKEKMTEIDNAKPKTAKNKFTEKLNIQSNIVKLDAQLKQQENDLKQFNKKF